jgi:hypothetical protein
VSLPPDLPLFNTIIINKIYNTNLKAGRQALGLEVKNEDLDSY